MDSDLYYAVINDKVDVLKSIGSKISISNQRSPTDSTVLHLACHYGSIECVKEILNVYESLLLQLDSRGETALHLAAREGHHDVVEALINKAKSALLQPNYHENTSSTVIQILIRLVNVEFETALHVAVRNKHNHVVQLLVKQDPRHPYPRNVHDETPLYLAVLKGDAQMIRTILDNCELPTFDGPDGRTALHAAVLDYRKKYECVDLLLQKNIDLIKVADNYGWTVFHYMAYHNHYEIVEGLVASDRSVAYLADKEYKRTALHVAAYQGNVSVMEELVKCIPDSLETLDASGKNIFHIAAEQSQDAVIRLILTQGGKVSNKLLIQRDNEGNTPLHMIVKFGCYVKELMGISTLDWEVPNNKNLTPLDLLDFPFEQNAQSGQTRIRNRLVNLNSRKRWQLWCTLKDPYCEKPDIEKGNTAVLKRNDKMNQKEVELFNKINGNNMIVAALIVTIALTAGFAMPGGFDGNEGAAQGSAVLVRKTAFQAFMVTDSIALLFSISSLFLYINTPFYQDADIIMGIMVAVANTLNLYSLVAIMLAFITGTYAVLGHSPALAISICVISSFFFPLVYYVYWRLPLKVS